MLDSLAPARRRTVLAALALALLVVVGTVLAVVLDRRADEVDPVAQDRLGPVLLVPGYGGATGGLERLAASLRIGGRRTQVVRPSDPTGDLRRQAEELGEAVDEALADGAPSVDVVGYSAGGVVVRWWVEELGGASQARRVVTLASPHDGTDLAALGGLAGDACPEACRQLAPGSDLLRRLPVDDVAEGPRWTAVWTEDDRTVVPPDSGRLEGDGVLSYSLQSVCPGLELAHADVPESPVVAAAVEAALGTPAPTPPDPAVCP